MQSARNLVARFLSLAVLCAVLSGVKATAQEVPQQSITLGDFKITLGLQKDDLFRNMESAYWLVNTAPPVRLGVRQGYKAYLVYAKDPNRKEDLRSLSFSDPIGELGFQDDTLVLAVKFWLKRDEKISDRLLDAVVSITADVPACPLKPLAIPNTVVTVIPPFVCGDKALRVYDGRIEEILEAAERRFSIRAASVNAVDGWRRMKIEHCRSNCDVWVSPSAVITASDVEQAEAAVSVHDNVIVRVVFTDAGASKMHDLMALQVRKLISLVVDDKVIWAPTVTYIPDATAKQHGTDWEWSARSDARRSCADYADFALAGCHWLPNRFSLAVFVSYTPQQ
jgi:SecD-like export protein